MEIDGGESEGVMRDGLVGGDLDGLVAGDGVMRDGLVGGDLDGLIAGDRVI